MISDIKVLVKLDFDNVSSNKYEFFKELSFFISKKIVKSKSAKVIENALLKREAMGTTGFEDGLAIPHAIIENLDNAYLIFIRLKNAVDWDSLDLKPVFFVFVILIAKDSEKNTHLKMISHLAYNLMDKDYQRQIKTGISESEISLVLEKMLQE